MKTNTNTERVHETDIDEADALLERRDLCEKSWHAVYYIGALPLVPHFTSRGVYVAPGGVEWTEASIMLMNWRRKSEFLWTRPWAVPAA